MSGHRINLDDEIQIPPPFDLIFGGLRQTVRSPALLKMRRSLAPSPFLPEQSMKLFIGEHLTHTGHVIGSEEFGVLRKTNIGKLELWLDPRYCTNT